MMAPMPDSSLDIATLGGHTMGTQWSAKLVTPRARDLHPLHAGIQARLDQVVAQMSTWEAASDISRYNRAEAGSWQPLPDAFARVMRCALDVAHRSDGAFDPSLGPLVALWGFGADAQSRRIPDAAVLAATRARCGWQRLVLRDDGQLLQPGGLQLDLSAIAKGFAVDHVVQWLREAGIASALVEVGGELYGMGTKPDAQPWRVLVESSPDEDAGAAYPPRVLALDGVAVATSGDRWHHYEQGGQRYSHSMDPRSGMPVTRAAAAVSVIAADAMHADAWATALTVMGHTHGLAFANTHDVAARFVWRDDDGLHEAISTAFHRHLPANNG